MKSIYLIGLVLLIGAQWYFLGESVWENEMVLRKGRQVKFLAAPVDPDDPFRGKFIRLNFAENRFPKPAHFQTKPNQKIYVLLSTDSAGFVHIRDLTLKKPSDTSLYVEAAVGAYPTEKETEFVQLDYPFNRFYLDEFKAPGVESAFNQNRSDSSRKTYALISIKKGKAVIRDLVIRDSSLSSISGSEK